MANYGDLKARIADELADSTISSQIILAIDTAIKHYERKEFYFNTKTGTFSTVVGQEWYGTAANADIPNLVKIISMTRTVQGYKRPIDIVPFTEIDKWQDNAATGDPEAAAYFNKQIRLYPLPNSVVTVTMAYVYRLDALDADADENAWTSDAEELIRQKAKAIVAADVLRDADIYQAATEMERIAYNALRSESRRSVRLLQTDFGGGRYNIYTDR